MCLMILMFGACSGKDKVYDPIKYGAKADGTTLCTEAIQKAIDECASAGGTVRLSGGRSPHEFLVDSGLHFRDWCEEPSPEQGLLLSYLYLHRFGKITYLSEGKPHNRGLLRVLENPLFLEKLICSPLLLMKPVCVILELGFLSWKIV